MYRGDCIIAAEGQESSCCCWWTATETPGAGAESGTTSCLGLCPMPSRQGCNQGHTGSCCCSHPTCPARQQQLCLEAVPAGQGWGPLAGESGSTAHAFPGRSRWDSAPCRAQQGQLLAGPDAVNCWRGVPTCWPDSISWWARFCPQAIFCPLLGYGPVVAMLVYFQFITRKSKTNL